MSKKQQHAQHAQKHETDKPAVPVEPPPSAVFDPSQVAKVTLAGEVVFIGTIEDATRAALERGFEFSMDDLTLLTDDETERYNEVAQQSSLGMGNIIAAVAGV